ncbi:ABC transporter ATP-binding protein [Desulfovibrio litoralis]|uniref:Putative ABC transport system ATP-binding protein n=1 Tax=Desulfovibrio litoralis DSM 11393 TaxID=1121455 RepID=A0A1M7TMV4_9BACT|nr:ATP-binding cassette domain-containing protein [Desulfovibrio litoralis]SHN71968.1 putative ABC transport system ATP-binding protein [Desulfovibrio litoralis DSM 11393]
MNPLIETKDLEFNKILTYPDMKIFPNQTSFITGKSGSGKSTLFKLFNKTLNPSRGKVFYNNNDIAELNTLELRKEILLVGQSVFLFDKNIRDNFSEYYTYLDKKTPNDDLIKKYLGICCADFSLDKDCISMSGGERHRVYLAICISLLPKVLLIDEPTAALDTLNSIKLIENLLNFSKENFLTMLIISHDQALTETFSQQTIKIGE